MQTGPPSATPEASPPPSAPDTETGSGRRDHIAAGISLRIASAGAFSIMTALLKLAAEHGVVAPEMLFYRALFGLPVVLLWIVLRPGIGAVRTERPWAHVFRCALGITSILTVFQALTMLSLADAATINFTAPIFATLLSGLILRETVGPHRWLAVAVGFIGVAVVMRPGAGHAPPLAGVAVALMAAFGQASVTVTLRQLKDTEHVAAIVFWFFVASLGVGALLLPVFGSWHDAPTLWLLAGGGIMGGLAQLLMTASVQSAPVAVIAPFDYLQLIGAVIFGWWLMASPPTMNTLAGAALIAASGLYTVWREHVRRRDRLIQPTAAPI